MRGRYSKKKVARKVTCRMLGHDWERKGFSTSSTSFIEKFECKRCGDKKVNNFFESDTKRMAGRIAEQLAVKSPFFDILEKQNSEEICQLKKSL